MAQVSDFKINSQVRRILTRNWLDLKKLRYSSIGGIVYLRGTIDVIYGAPATRASEWEGLTARYVDKVEKDIKRIREVRRVRFELDNWRKGVDGWSQVTAS